jgi:effector-binding domain-containing protein
MLHRDARALLDSPLAGECITGRLPSECADGGDVFKIGEFSKFCFVTVKTLRHYDRIGLLPPARVDEATGYRYYSADQIPKLNRILALKDLGLTLEQIGNLSNGALSPDQIRGMLRLRRAELSQRMEDDRARLAQVEWRLQQIERFGPHPDYDVVIKAIPEQRVASIRRRIPVALVFASFGEVHSYLESNGIPSAGPPTALYYDEDFPSGPLDVETAVPIATSVVLRGRITESFLPRTERMACVVHQGSFETLGRGYERLLEWVEANECRIAGPVREVHLQGPHSRDEPAAFVTEIQLPVEKSPSKRD